MTTLIGRKLFDFNDDQGKQVKGFRLYYTAPDDDVTGLACAYLFVGANKTDLFNKVANLKFPVEADLVYSASITSGKPYLSDIRLK